MGKERAESLSSDDDESHSDSEDRCRRCQNYKKNAVMAYKYARKTQNSIARLTEIENVNGQLQKINIEQRDYIECLLQKNRELEREKSEAELYLRDTKRLYSELLERHRTVINNVAEAQQHLSASNEYKKKYEEATKMLAEVAQKRYVLIQKYKHSVQLLKEHSRLKVENRKDDAEAEKESVPDLPLPESQTQVPTTSLPDPMRVPDIATPPKRPRGRPLRNAVSTSDAEPVFAPNISPTGNEKASVLGKEPVEQRTDQNLDGNKDPKFGQLEDEVLHSPSPTSFPDPDSVPVPVIATPPKRPRGLPIRNTAGTSDAETQKAFVLRKEPVEERRERNLVGDKAPETAHSEDEVLHSPSPTSVLDPVPVPVISAPPKRPRGLPHKNSAGTSHAEAEPVCAVKISTTGNEATSDPDPDSVPVPVPVIATPPKRSRGLPIRNAAGTADAETQKASVLGTEPVKQRRKRTLDGDKAPEIGQSKDDVLHSPSPTSVPDPVPVPVPIIAAPPKRPRGRPRKNTTGTSNAEPGSLPNLPILGNKEASLLEVQQTTIDDDEAAVEFPDDLTTEDILILMGKLCPDEPMSALPLPESQSPLLSPTSVPDAVPVSVIAAPSKRSRGRPLRNAAVTAEAEPVLAAKISTTRKEKASVLGTEPVKQRRKRTLDGDKAPEIGQSKDDVIHSPSPTSVPDPVPVPVPIIAAPPKRPRGRPRKNATGTSDAEPVSLPKSMLGNKEASLLDVLQTTIDDSAVGYDCGKMQSKMQPFRSIIGLKDAKSLSEGIVKIAVRMNVGNLRNMLVQASQQNREEGASGIVLGAPEKALFEFAHHLKSFDGLSGLFELIFEDMLLECRRVRHTSRVQYSKYIRCLSFSYVLAVQSNESCSSALTSQLSAFLRDILFSFSPDITIPSLCCAITLVPGIFKDVFLTGNRDFSSDLLILHLAGRPDLKLVCDLTSIYIGQDAREYLIKRTSCQLLELHSELLENAVQKALSLEESDDAVVTSAFKECCALFMPFLTFGDGTERNGILSGLLADCEEVLNALEKDYNNDTLLEKAKRLLHLTSRLIISYGSTTTDVVAHFVATTLNSFILKMYEYMSAFAPKSPAISSAIKMWLKAVQPFSKVTLIS